MRTTESEDANLLALEPCQLKRIAYHKPCDWKLLDLQQQQQQKNYPTLQMVEYEWNPTIMLQLVKLCKSLNQMDIH